MSLNVRKRPEGLVGAHAQERSQLEGLQVTKPDKLSVRRNEDDSGSEPVDESVMNPSCLQ